MSKQRESTPLNYLTILENCYFYCDHTVLNAANKQPYFTILLLGTNSVTKADFNWASRLGRENIKPKSPLKPVLVLSVAVNSWLLCGEALYTTGRLPLSGVMASVNSVVQKHKVVHPPAKSWTYISGHKPTAFWLFFTSFS